MKKVGIIYGGTSTESLPSEKNAIDIEASLRRRGYHTMLIEYDEHMIDTLKEDRPDIVFLCVQGKHHGDGTLQAILDFLHIPYTGSPMGEAALINDKIKCKILFDHFGFDTPKWFTITKKQYNEGGVYFGQLGYPFVVKAPTQGGSYGIALIKRPEDLPKIGPIFEYDDVLLIEQFIKGGAFTIGILEKGDKLITMPCVEMLDERNGKEDELILMKDAYSAKPALLDAGTIGQMETMALGIFKETGARDYARIDFMVSNATGRIYALEINAVPGLKKESLIPRSAVFMGLDYDDMIEGILLNALRRYRI